MKVSVNLTLDQADLIRDIIEDKRDEFHDIATDLRDQQKGREIEDQEVEEEIQSYYRKVAMLSDALLEF